MTTSSSVEEYTVVTSKPARQASPQRKRQPAYAVIVENDEFHTFLYVIKALIEICGHGPEKSYVLTKQIHETGRAIVWTGTMELAELKRDQIRGFGPDDFAPKPVTFPLGVYIEPIEG